MAIQSQTRASPSSDSRSVANISSKVSPPQPESSRDAQKSLFARICATFFNFLLLVLVLPVGYTLSLMSSKAAKEQARKDGLIAQFRQVTGASQNDAVKYLRKHSYKLEAALDGIYSDPAALASISSGPRGTTTGPSTKKISDIFDKYKDPDADDITVEGTMEFCKDIKLDLEDVGILALSHELNSPQMGVFTRQGWTDGWRTLQCDSVASMGTCAAKLRSRLQSDSAFFRRIYMYAFEFAKSPGQRSIPIDNAKAFWSLLLPLALTSVEAKQDFKGWQPEYNDWWFEFLDVKKVKGISKDAWSMFLDFVQSIDSKFSTYDEAAAWPSLVDDFVEWARDRVPA